VVAVWAVDGLVVITASVAGGVVGGLVGSVVGASAVVGGSVAGFVDVAALVAGTVLRAGRTVAACGSSSSPPHAANATSNAITTPACRCMGAEGMRAGRRCTTTFAVIAPTTDLRLHLSAIAADE
jgi:hypothetical protein